MKTNLGVIKSLTVVFVLGFAGVATANSAGLVKYEIKDNESIEGSLTGGFWQSR